MSDKSHSDFVMSEPGGSKTVCVDSIKWNLKGETIMKKAEELNALKEELETLNNKLQELTEEELMLVTGGATLDFFLTYVAVGGCGFSSEIRKTTNKCTQSNICSFTNIECQYR